MSPDTLPVLNLVVGGVIAIPIAVLVGAMIVAHVQEFLTVRRYATADAFPACAACGSTSKASYRSRRRQGWQIFPNCRDCAEPAYRHWIRDMHTSASRY